MIRPAVPADAAEFARVFVAAWRAGYRGVVPDQVIDSLDESAWAQQFADRLAAGALDSIAWAERDSVLGFARYGPDPDRPTAVSGYLSSLYVDPAASGRGIGAALLERVVTSLAAQGRTEVSLWVFTANARARALYERAGFRATDETVIDPQWGVPQLRYRRG